MANFDLFRSMYHNHVETSGAFYRPFGPYLDGEPVSISLEAPGMRISLSWDKDDTEEAEELENKHKYLGATPCSAAAAAGTP